jgi:hypothetical protein
MQRPKHISGMCPHFDHATNKCYLTESTQSGYTLENKCKNESNCKNCGNYEAWKSGSNYKNK